VTVRSIVLAFALATFDMARELFKPTEPAAIIHVQQEIEVPQYFYLRVDDCVFALKLSD
jgi:hypothetical protein